WIVKSWPPEAKRKKFRTKWRDATASPTNNDVQRLRPYIVGAGRSTFFTPIAIASPGLRWLRGRKRLSERPDFRERQRSKVGTLDPNRTPYVVEIKTILPRRDRVEHSCENFAVVLPACRQRQ